MTDSRLRELERRWRQSGAVDDRLAYDNERVRAGLAIETGFVVRVADSAGAYRDKAVVYRAGCDARDVSFRSVIGSGFMVRDVEFADGQFQLLAFRRSGGNSVSRILSVDAQGGVKVGWETVSSHDSAPVALLNYNGELGRIYSDELHSVRFANDTLGFLRDQTIFGYAGSVGFVAMQAGVVVGGNPQVVALTNTGDRIVADGQKKVRAVFVEGSSIYCPVGVAASSQWEGTRLAESRYFAASELELLRGYQGRALTLTKTLLEVPKMCLDGLLLALK